MFTGLIQAKGRVVSMTPVAQGVRLAVEPLSEAGDIAGDVPGVGVFPGAGDVPGVGVFPGAGAGDSVAVNGCCLTHAPRENSGSSNDIDKTPTLWFDVIHQTLRETTLGQLAVDDEVNLETSVTPNTPMGGHFVQGHVDTVGEIVSVDQTDQEYRIRLKIGEAWMPYMVPRGSVTLDGVSLTLAEVVVDQATIEVALIQTTLDHTTLKQWQVGGRVNVEGDVLVKATVNYLRHFSESAGGKK